MLILPNECIFQIKSERIWHPTGEEELPATFCSLCARFGATGVTVIGCGYGYVPSRPAIAAIPVVLITRRFWRNGAFTSRGLSRTIVNSNSFRVIRVGRAI